jgi:ATP-dependent Clp protease, protease subunit
VTVTEPNQPVRGRLPEWLDETMMQRRTVLLRGPLDDALAIEVAARLMTLDATGDEGVLLHLGSSDGTLGAAFTVMDTIEALGVPVTAICTGAADGPALGVLAVAHHRWVAPHSRLRLSEPGIEAHGSLADLNSQLEQHRILVQLFVSRVAAAAKQPAERVEVDLLERRSFDPIEAVSYGLADAIGTGPESQVAPQAGT